MIPQEQHGHRAMSLTVFGVESIEDVDKELVNDVHDLAVVLIDGHLKVQPSELAQMPVSEGVLSPAGHHNSVIQSFLLLGTQSRISREDRLVHQSTVSASVKSPSVTTKTRCCFNNMRLEESC